MRRATTLGMCLAIVGLVGWSADDAKTKKTEIGPATFEVPADWQTQRPSSSFRKLQWGIPTVEGDETAPVFYVSTAGGGVEANVKRWIDSTRTKTVNREKTIEANGIKFSTLKSPALSKGGPGGGLNAGLPNPRHCRIPRAVPVLLQNARSPSVGAGARVHQDVQVRQVGVKARRRESAAKSQAHDQVTCGFGRSLDGVKYPWGPRCLPEIGSRIVSVNRGRTQQRPSMLASFSWCSWA